LPSPASPIVELLAELRQALARLGVRWYLFGAQAAILYGVDRLTADVDVTVDPGPHPTARLVAGLGGAGFELRVADVGGFVDATRILPLVHRGTRIPVDVVLAGPGLEELFFARAEERDIGGVRVPVASAEDLVTMKVLAGRPRDLDDMVSMLRTRGDTLDLDRVRTTLGLLEKALERRDLLPELERAIKRARGGRPER
jgi:Nucleotidyl transferase AbiEii toxin, Type IV TA system